MLFQLSCTFLSLLLNFFLIFLIINKSPKQMGNYKYLMIYTACFEIFYTIFDLIADAVSDKDFLSLSIILSEHIFSWSCYSNLPCP